jgi:hypothetical protein
MTWFYWTMAGLTIATFIPSAFFMVLYAATGEDGCLRRAKALWGYSKLFGLLGFNIGVWGHVLVGLWNLIF